MFTTCPRILIRYAHALIESNLLSDLANLRKSIQWRSKLSAAILLTGPLLAPSVSLSSRRTADASRSDLTLDMKAPRGGLELLGTRGHMKRRLWRRSSCI